jgi:hypothetical protein
MRNHCESSAIQVRSDGFWSLYAAFDSLFASKSTRAAPNRRKITAKSSASPVRSDRLGHFAQLLTHFLHKNRHAEHPNAPLF